MKQAIFSEIARQGYAFLDSYHPEMNTEAVAKSFGLPFAPFDGRLIQKLVPRTTSSPNTYSGIFGLGRFPFHTDLAHWPTPPRYLMLRCQVGYSDVPTQLVDGAHLIRDLTLNTLNRALFKPRKPKEKVFRLLRLCEEIGNNHMLRWDSVFLTPASRMGNTANQLVREWLDQCEPLLIALDKMGDTLIVDNWRMLHARPPVLPEGRDRCLERIYLESLK